MAEKEANVILWDGGNNDYPFVRSDLSIVVLDALRPGHEVRYFPGETNLRSADVLVLNKVSGAIPDALALLRRHAAEFNPKATLYVANFSLVTSARFTDQSGQQQQRTDWHRVVAFGKLADTCQQFLSKGRQVYVEGRLRTRQYQAKDGTGMRSRTEIVAFQIRMLGNRAAASRPTEAKDDIPF